MRSLLLLSRRNACFRNFSVFIISVTFFTLNAFSQCTNADFSMGDFTNWQGQTGSCCPINLPTNGIVGGRHTIMSVPGTDPNTGNVLQLICPGYNFSARLGNNGTGAQAEGLRYTYIPTASTALFEYNYAVVLQDPSHAPSEQPRFEIQVRDQFGNVIPCTLYEVAAGNGIPGFQSNGSIRWKDWTTVGLDLTAYIGTPVTIEARTGDCSLGGHYGYGYLVGDCHPLEIQVRYCVGDTSAVLTAPGGFASYLWSTGETTQSITIYNPNPGVQNINCTITSVTGCQAVLSTIIDPIVIDPGFTMVPACYNTGQFTDTSVVFNDVAAQWTWDFGDGNTSNQQNPSHTYSAPGNYNVQLITHSNLGCLDTIIIPVTITPDPVADFLLPTDCGLTVNFTDQSYIPAGGLGVLVGWEWDFGDGNTSNAQNPTHTYASAGTWDVQLVVTNDRNCTDTIVLQYTNNEYPQAGFNMPPLCGLTGTFTDGSQDFFGGVITGWEWDFGDGNTSNSQSPAHTYTSEGTYDVQLIVTDDGGCTDTLVQQYTNNEFPVADMILPTDCGLNVTFNDNSSDPAGGNITGWQWDFGDGNTANVQNPSNTYASENIWPVQLIITDDAGCTDTVAMNYQSKELPVADYTFNDVCYGIDMPFTDQSATAVAVISGWEWDFGDSNGDIAQNTLNNYASWGNYDVELVVTTTLGCTDTIVKQVMVYPLPVVDYTAGDVCLGSSTVFNNNSNIPFGTINSYEWDFGVGYLPVSNQTNPSVVYTSEGMYTVQLIATSDFGCIDSVSKNVNVWPTPQVDFSAGPLAGCYPLDVVFDNLTTISSGTVNYTWDFGDGSNSMTFEPNHVYPNGYNLYTVTLYAVSDHGCDTSITFNNYITVYPNPTAQFMHDPPYMTITDNGMQFINLSIGATTYDWDFGDGNGSSVENPYHFFADTGSYPITLITANQYGCMDTVQYTVIVKPDFTIYVPNSFTPNGDGVNDYFRIVGTGLVEAELLIFDRWGEPLAKLDKDQPFNIGWDGIYAGQPVKQDVYTYKLMVKDILGDLHEVHGHINVIY